jgi:uncharacterized protein DUF2470
VLKASKESVAHPDRLAEVVRRPDASALVRVDVEQVWLDGAPVELDAYRQAECDPLAAGSDKFVAHLVQHHAAGVVLLAHLLDAATVYSARLIAPTGVDRFGLTFRLVGDAGTTRTRLNFPAALRGPA